MEKEQNTIGKDFTMLELIKFVSLPVISKLALSVLSTLDDSLFISRYCGENALAAFSLAMPWWMIVDAFSMAISCASVKCSILMGEKKQKEARDSFATMAIVAVIFGAIFSLVLTIFRYQICDILGETEITKPFILTYFSISRLYTPLVFLTNMFNRFYILAGKPKMAVASTTITTFCNFFFDWIFIVNLNTGIIGCAYANLIGLVCASLLGLVFFSNKKEEIYFGKPIKNPFPLIKEVFRLGRSSSLTSFSLSANSYITNHVLLYIGGEVIISAFSIVNNVQFMFLNAFFGCLDSSSPIVSYAFGEKNANKLAKSMKQIAKLLVGLSLVIALIYKLATPLVLKLYLANNDNAELLSMTKFGMSVAPFTFTIFGLNVMVQELANAVGNSKLSTTLSMLENVLFSNLASIALPLIFGQTGVWFSFLVAEGLTFIFTIAAIIKNQNVYGYGPQHIASFVNQ